MGMMAKIPQGFETRAERRSWYSRADAESLLDWLEDNGHRLVGMDVAQKQDDGNWTLLSDGLDLTRQTENFEAVRMGRVFLTEYDGDGRMFEPVWQDRAR